MSREITYCETKECPIKEKCQRYKPNQNRHVWIFTESPGAYRDVQGERTWVCDKHLKKENHE
jgi:hypothetical protein